MRRYKAFIRDKKTGKGYVQVSETTSKKQFISDIRANGFSVNATRIAIEPVYNYIMDRTNAEDFEFKRYKKIEDLPIDWLDDEGYVDMSLIPESLQLKLREAESKLYEAILVYEEMYHMYKIEYFADGVTEATEADYRKSKEEMYKLREVCANIEKEMIKIALI